MSSKENQAYKVIRARYSTEKTSVLQNLCESQSSKSLKRCTSAKYTFMVAKTATKAQIASAIEAIYAEQGIQVIKVNTLLTKPKEKRLRKQKGFTSVRKKAIVTLASGQKLPE